MRCLSIALFLFVPWQLLHAQGMIYRTFAEYANGTGEVFDGAVDVAPVMGRFALNFSSRGERQRIACRRIWGFKYKDVLFRIEQEGHLPVRLMTHGSICYYENGFAHLQMQHDSTEAAGFAYGFASYVSSDLQGEIVPARFPEKDDHTCSARFKKEHPVYVELFRCIGDQEDMDRTRQCVVEYEVAMEEKR